MADERTSDSSVVKDAPTVGMDTTNEVTNGTVDAAPVATTASDSTATETKNADLTTDDVAAAGARATTDISPPNGEGAAEADPAAANAEPASADAAASSKGKRKSSAGVPEHKSKKLNKKKSTPTLRLDVEPGQHFWARLKGWAPWPSVCCDEEMLPESLLANRPVSTKRPDGTYREDFLEGGKNARDRTYPIMFLATNEFSWMINTSLTPLDPKDCEGKENDKKLSKDLKQAYQIASEEHDLDYYKGLLKQHEDEMKEYLAEQARLESEAAEKEAKKAEKAEKAADKEPKDTKKKSRKSKGGDADEMDVDDEEKPTKKRKKEAESEGEGPKPKKTPKVKLTGTTKEPGSASAKKAKTKKTVVKPDSDADDGVNEAPLTDAEKLAKREQGVLFLRHRLQKGFLSRDTPPKEEEMAGMAEFFNSLESHTDLEPAIIRSTKIHKVLKAIVKLDSIPKEEEFQFKKRSSALLDAWSSALEDKPPATNGDIKEDKKDGEDTTKVEEDASKEPSAAPVEATNPGNGATDEADVTMADMPAVEAKADKPAEGAADAIKEAAEEAKEADQTEEAAVPAAEKEAVSS